jgi:DNA end-binding protein Ku
MPLRPAWSGFLRLSLVSVPVQAFNAVETDQTAPTLHQLHRGCNSRIRYQKVCPVHGEVERGEIVSGYEFAPNQYVIVDDAELKAIVPDATGIQIATFIPPSAVDPTYYEGRSYYLAPDGQAGLAPFALLREAMREEKRWALAEAVLWGRNRQVLVRPVDELLVMSFVLFGNQVRAADELVERVTAVKLKADEVKLARRLIAETTEDRIDWTKRRDEQGDAVRKLIEAKVAGERIVTEQPAAERPVINLMDALKRSLRRDHPSPRSSRTKAIKRETQSRRTPPRKLRKSS